MPYIPLPEDKLPTGEKNNTNTLGFAKYAIVPIVAIVLLLILCCLLNAVSEGINRLYSSLFESTPTPIVSTAMNTPTPLAQPTRTVQPTVTRMPSLELPFYDNFDNGIRPEWRIVEGQTVIDRGALKSLGNSIVTLEIGNQDMDNYFIEFECIGEDDCEDTIITIGRKLQIEIAIVTRWKVLQDDKWVEIAETPIIDSLMQVNRSFIRVIVRNNEYQLLVNGNLCQEITLNIPFNGPVGVTVNNNWRRVAIDNFKISSLDVTRKIDLPFYDSFTGGIRPEWQVLSGQPSITNGTLGTSGDLDSILLEVGDDTWHNYDIEFDCLGGDCNLVIGFANKIRLSLWRFGGWDVWDGTEWQQTTSDEILGFFETEPHIQILVEGNKYRLFVDGTLRSEIIYGDPLSGPLYIILQQRTRIDNFNVR